jgi:uncharacterized membrane protein
MAKGMTATVAGPGEGRMVSSVSSGRSLFLVAALCLLTIGTALRVYHLGDRSLWYDEAVTANASRGTFTQMLEDTRRFSAPIVHPSILYLVEKVRKSAVAVRAPSALASILAVAMMLLMVRAKASPSAALFSAAILAVSASQIRYAQEVREYSFAVLCAAILIFALLRWEASGSRSNHPALLYAAMFIAPLVQYGLVFFACGILITIVLRRLMSPDTCFTLSRAVIAFSSLVAGGILSFFLTLRYQFQSGKTPWYLASDYFDRTTMSLPRFLTMNSKGLLGFLIPGSGIALCLTLAAVVFCIARARSRKVDSITLLTFCSLLIVLCASVARVYPYGGVRQCLFLAPVVALFAGVVFADLLHRIRGPLEPIATVAVLALLLLSLFRATLNQWPYGEFEDTQSLLRELAKSSAPNDQVWVNHDAVAAFQFYLQTKDPRFIYGRFHADAKEYMPELIASVDPHSDRLWLAFSHLEQPSDRGEEILIVHSLRQGWDVQPVVAATNAELYVAHRRITP